MWEVLEEMSVRKTGNLPRSMSFLKKDNLLAEICFMEISNLSRFRLWPATLHFKNVIL